MAALVAGGWAGGRPLHTEVGDATRTAMLTANLETVHRGLRALLPAMVAAKRGAIVVIGSRAGVEPATSAGAAAYAASKAAAIALVEATGAEVRDAGRARQRRAAQHDGHAREPARDARRRREPLGVDDVGRRGGGVSPERRREGHPRRRRSRLRPRIARDAAAAGGRFLLACAATLAAHVSGRRHLVRARRAFCAGACIRSRLVAFPLSDRVPITSDCAPRRFLPCASARSSRPPSPPAPSGCSARACRARTKDSSTRTGRGASSRPRTPPSAGAPATEAAPRGACPRCASTPTAA